MRRVIQKLFRRFKPASEPKAVTFSDELLGNALGEIQKGDLERARAILDELLQKEPDHLQALVYYGMAAMPRDFEKAGRALEKALSLNPDNAGALYWAGELKWMVKDWKSAIAYLQRLAEDHPTSINWRRLGLVLKEAGCKKEAREAFSQAANPQTSKVSQELSIKEKASRLFDLYQLPNTEKFCEALDSLCKSENRLNLPEAVVSLRKNIQNKNLIILASGPSLALLGDFTIKLDADKKKDLRFFGFNTVPIIEEYLSELKLSDLDIACMSHPQVVKRHEKWLFSFLDRPNKILCLPKIALSESKNLSEKVKTLMPQVLLYNSESNHPPCAQEPLHFPPINTLMHVLPLSILGLPRKIFLFGCDGIITDKSHFRIEDRRYALEDCNPREMAQWLRKDTFVFDEMIHPLIKTCSRLWKVPIPPIFNCFENSGYSSFEKIGSERFSREISD